MNFSKKFLVLMVVFLAAVAFSAGCTGTSGTGSQTPEDAGVAGEDINSASVPNLVGVWTGNWTGHSMNRGFQEKDSAWLLNVTEQNGQVFTGYKVYTKAGSEEFSENFSGAISHDGETIYIVDHEDGTAYCSLISPDELEVVYMSDDSDAQVLIVDLFRQ